jgi:hypothetical protein
MESVDCGEHGKRRRLPRETYVRREPLASIDDDAGGLLLPRPGNAVLL